LPAHLLSRLSLPSRSTAAVGEGAIPEAVAADLIPAAVAAEDTVPVARTRARRTAAVP